MGSWCRAVITRPVICKDWLELLLGPSRQDLQLGQARFKQLCHSAPWISRCHSLTSVFSPFSAVPSLQSHHGRQQSGLEHVEAFHREA